MRSLFLCVLMCLSLSCRDVHAETNALLAGSNSVAQGEAVTVRLTQTQTGWQLERSGRPFRSQGAGGDGARELLARSGANSIRTWGVGDSTASLLDEAQRLGLSVTVGIWLGHERHGFDYSDYGQVSQQIEQVRSAVRQFRDHPAVLMWSIGNEMEGYEKGDNPAIWSHIEFLAREVKRLDPNHPVMTVVAEIGGNRVVAIHKLCPSVDVVGVNSYGGVVSLPERYRKAGGTKPYVVTEFGPPGVWEIKRNAFNAVEEWSSTAKADFYKRGYKAVHADQELCLGSYAFTWGAKQEATATWFGMLLPDGKRLAAADTMAELWTGQSPKNRCPGIESLRVAVKVDSVRSFAPKSQLSAELQAVDPEKDNLRVVWQLTEDSQNYVTGGDVQVSPEVFPDAITSSDNNSVQLTLPEWGGIYRLYAYVYDDHGGAAVANVPIKVDGPKRIRPARKAELPLTVIGEPLEKPAYFGAGWMGESKSIVMNEQSTERPHSGETCLKVEYSKPDGWAGVVWQNTPGDWGDLPGGLDLTGAKRLVFFARGKAGGETVKFSVGTIGPDKPYHDTARVSIKVALKKDWTRYEIDLRKKDLSRLKSGFVWVVAGQGRPIAFYLDDVRFE